MKELAEQEKRMTKAREALNKANEIKKAEEDAVREQEEEIERKRYF